MPLIDQNEFSSVIREFAAYKATIQNCSSKTIDEYLLDLRTFFRYLTALDKDVDPASPEAEALDVSLIGVKRLEAVEQMDILAFLRFAKEERGNGWAALARKLSAIRALFHYLTAKAHYIAVDPTQNLETPRKTRRLPKVMTLDESVALLRTVKNDTDAANHVRDYCILTLFLNCGMRVSELVGINLSDIDSELRSLRVVGKGNKERLVYLNQACQMALIDYLQIRMGQKYAKLDEKALFLSRLEQRISVKTVQEMVYKYLGQSGLGTKHYSVHKLRHTAATLMYQSGEVDIRVLKDILGHEQLNTTQIYTHVSDVNMELAMQHNPLATLGQEKKKK